MILTTAFALFAWLVTGFNVVEGAVPLIGIQWSTFATFSAFFYLMMVNFQVGGLQRVGQLVHELRYDLLYLKLTFTKGLSARQHYERVSVVNPLRAFIMSLLVCMAALFLFESVWVPLYDYFQFGSVLWPVYFAVVSPPVILRNMGLFVFPLLLVGLMLDLGFQNVRLKLRLDFGALWLGMLAAVFWLGWITFPHQTVSVMGLASAQVIGPQSGTFNLASCYIWPGQQFFPQNTYTFYPCALKGLTYTPPEILGFFNPDPWVHAVNVMTKAATFGALVYPFMTVARGRR